MDKKPAYKYNIHGTRLIKHGNRLDYIKPSMKKLFDEFVKNVGPNQVVDVYFEAHDGTGTSAQLKKIHACIREIAFEMGDTFESVKSMVKSISGLKFPLQGEPDYEKSFAVCSVRELAIVIQAIIEAGDEIGINFRGVFPQYYEEEGL
jgi:hypothetical protein